MKTFSAFIEELEEGVYRVDHKYGRDTVKAKNEREAQRKVTKKAGIAKGHEGKVTKISESFKRGDLLHVPGANGTKHPAVHLGKKAVYLDDEGETEPVPESALSKATKMPRATAKHKELASRYLENMKEDLSLEDFSIEDIEAFMMSEEYEQLDELSKKTLGSYLRKASDQRQKNEPERRNSFDKHLSGEDDHYQKRGSKLTALDVSKKYDKIDRKRAVGMDRAIKKLTKESTDLSEDTLLEFTYGKEYSEKHVKDKIKTGNWEAVNDVTPGKHVEMRHHTGKRVTIKVK